MLPYSYVFGCKSATVATRCLHFLRVQNFDTVPSEFKVV